jgi:ABC-2 type transport system ATP-binding protein
MLDAPATRLPSLSTPVLRIERLGKTYSSGYAALTEIDLEIFEGEIFALLGPNGAGKTTLIGIVCGLVNPSAGRVLVAGHDVVRDFRAARSLIGLVPQELSTDMFETVWDTMKFSRGLFGKPQDDALLEKILRELSLWEKKDSKIMTLSGGMKRRVLIAKALVHEPRILFLDEPTAGVDVELRRDMWALVAQLRQTGVTIILTTHYIEEAEEMADRVGVINKGRIVLVEEKKKLMQSLGKKELILQIQEPLSELPVELADKNLALSEDGFSLTYTFDTHAESTGIAALLKQLNDAGITCKDLNTRESSLEDIFVSLVHEQAASSPVASTEVSP